MTMKLTKKQKLFCKYLFLAIVGIVMIYPILWLFFGAFKTNSEIFGSTKLLPKNFSLDAFVNGWKGNGQITYTTFFINTLLLVVPTVVFTLASSILVAYGFARFDFRGKGFLFSIVIATLLLPNSVIIIPRYLLYNKFHWLNSYMPFYAQAICAANPFFVFMLVQFLRGIPKELDEAAYIDGCSTFATFTRILLPLSKASLFSAAIFQFVWTWNDFHTVLIYINSVVKYPLSLALKMSLDLSGSVLWNQVLAMSLLSIIPSTLLFFFAQDYFVDGIATSGLKG